MKLKNVFVYIYLVLMAFFLYFGGTEVYGAERTIKVGCIEMAAFLDIDENGNAKGYAAEYLNEISKYTGWEYEYVKGSWQECMQWVKDGTVDLLMPVQLTKEREKDYLFSSTNCCMSYTSLVGRKEDEQYYYEDFEHFNGMTVGMISGIYLNDIFSQYAKAHQFSVEKKEYPNGEALDQAMNQGEVDAIILGNMTHLEEQKLLAKIEYTPAYFVTSKKRPDLMAALNKAQRQIILNNPYFPSQLHQKYYGRVEQQAIGYTRDEAAYIAETKEITVLCSKNNYPMSWYDEKSGEVKGIYADILDIMEKKSGLRFKMVPVSSEAEEVKMLKDQQADVIMGVYASQVKAKEYNICFTDSYYEMPYLVLTKRNKNILDQTDLRAAVPDFGTGIVQWMREEHSDWEEVLYGDWYDCIKALKAGTVDVIPINMLACQTMEVFHTEPEFVNVVTEVPKIPVCMAVSGKLPDKLVSILNKTIVKIDTEEIDYCVLQNTNMAQQKYTLHSLIHHYPIFFA